MNFKITLFNNKKQYQSSISISMLKIIKKMLIICEDEFSGTTIENIIL
jgi:hypothetical protein